MYFKDLKINKFFSFLDDLKIYKKVNEFQCSRLLKNYPVWEDQEIIEIEAYETENHDLIERTSFWNFITKECKDCANKII